MGKRRFQRQKLQDKINKFQGTQGVIYLNAPKEFTKQRKEKAFKILKKTAAAEAGILAGLLTAGASGVGAAGFRAAGQKTLSFVGSVGRGVGRGAGFVTKEAAKFTLKHPIKAAKIVAGGLITYGALKTSKKVRQYFKSKLKPSGYVKTGENIGEFVEDPNTFGEKLGKFLGFGGTAAAAGVVGAGLGVAGSKIYDAFQNQELPDNYFSGQDFVPSMNSQQMSSPYSSSGNMPSFQEAQEITSPIEQKTSYKPRRRTKKKERNINVTQNVSVKVNAGNRKIYKQRSTRNYYGNK